MWREPNCPALGGDVAARYLPAQPWPGADFVAHWGRPEPWRALNRRQRHTLLCLAASAIVFLAVEAEKWCARRGWIYRTSTES